MWIQWIPHICRWHEYYKICVKVAHRRELGAMCAPKTLSDKIPKYILNLLSDYICHQVHLLSQNLQNSLKCLEWAIY